MYILLDLKSTKLMYYSNIIIAKKTLKTSMFWSLMSLLARLCHLISLA